MNSIKSTMTVLFLLAVSYGVYRLIHTPETTGLDAQYFGSSDSTDPSRSDSMPKDWIAKPMPQSQAPLSEQPSSTLKQAPPLVQSFPNPTMPPSRSVSESDEMNTNIDPGSAYAIESVPPASMAIPESPLTKLIPSVPPASENATVSGTSATMTPPAATEALAGNSQRLPKALSRPPVDSPSPLPGAAVPAEPKPGESPMADSAQNSNLLENIPLRTESPVAPANLQAAWPIVNAHVRNGEIASALQVLSGYYHAPMSDAERAELLTWLDTLAFKVIYSTEHRLSPMPHIVQQGETLDSIAENWKIPKELLINVNRTKLPADMVLTPGMELKIVRGPFRAEIDSQRKELTLFLDKYYAGRFAIDPSMCMELKPGACEIKSMTADPSGQYCMDLGSGIRLVAGAPSADGRSIQVNPADAKDVWGILSAQSQVTVVR